MQGLSEAGSMAAILAAPERVEPALKPFEKDVSIAAYNGPEQVVLSGRREALAALREVLAAQGIKSRELRVSHAFHSPLMEPMLAAFEQIVGRVELHPPALRLITNVTGEAAREEVCRPEYWRRQVREPVQFVKSLRTLDALGVDAFLELGPQPTLLGQARGFLGEGSRLWLPSLRKGHGDWSVILESLGHLFAAGAVIDWESFDKPYPRKHVLLPTYPWQHQRHYVEDGLLPRRSPQRLSGGRPLLGLAVQVSTQPGVRIWETQIDLQVLSWLRDHRVQEAIVFPATGYLEMALAAAKELWKDEAFAVEDMILHTALSLEEAQPRPVQLVVTEEAPGRSRFQISSRQSGTQDGWIRHVSGRLTLVRAEAPPAAVLKQIRSRCTEPISSGDHYAELSNIGMEFGPAFQGMAQILSGPAESLGEVCLPDALSPDAAEYVAHPVLLDACLQGLLAALGPRAGSGPLVPVGIESARVHKPLGRRALTHTLLRSAGPRDSVLKADVRVLDEAGSVLAEILGVQLQPLEKGRRMERSFHLNHEWWAAPRSEESRPARAEQLLLLAEGGGEADALRQVLLGAGATVRILQTDPSGAYSVQELSSALSGAPITAIVHLRSLDRARGGQTSLDSLEGARQRDCGDVLSVVQALARAALRNPPRLFLVTRGVHALKEDRGPLSPSAAVLWGLARTLASEQPELGCACLDLAPIPWDGEMAALGRELLSAEHEQEVALRAGGRFVGRLVRREAPTVQREQVVPCAGRPFRLELDTPGVLDGLRLRTLLRRPPEPGEVEIEVEAASLNFIDVLKAMGMYPGAVPAGGTTLLGYECAGRVVTIGDGVTDFAPGDPVLALTNGAFSSHVTTPVSRVARRPAGLRPEEAASVPAVFMTAYYGLVTLARLSRGERILIHSAAGGTGLAAVQLAQRIGAEIFATAGSPEKRAYLRSLGIEHVMDSRSLDFAEEIIKITRGGGVDVVLNSLTGAAIAKSFAVLAPYGRFVEIGKRDIYEDAPLGLGHFRKKLSYFTVDLDGMVQDRPSETLALLHQVLGEFERGSLRPSPQKVLPISQAQDAFRLMAQGGNLGKLVLTMADPAARIEIPTELALRGDATYLITGGLGALGLAAAGWMVEKGARHLVLMGRSGAASAEQRAALDRLRESGAEVEIARADVAQRAEVAEVLQRIRSTRPPLRGILHAAGVLDDGILLQQSVERFGRVLAPKVTGAINLHELSRDEPLDFFVLYSSAAVLFGPSGQGSYAAANAFLDVLAHYRRALGLPALCIDWGFFAGAGLASTLPDRGARITAGGFQSMTPEQGCQELGRLLLQEGIGPQIGVVPMDLRHWAKSQPRAAGSSLFTELLREARQGPASLPGDPALLQALRHAPSAQRIERIEEHLRKLLGQVLRMNPSEIDPKTPFRSLGVDSLMGLELRNRLEASLGLSMSVTMVWAYPDVVLLARHILSRLGLDAASEQEASAAAAGEPERAALEQLSDDELLRAAAEALTQSAGTES
jgi:NADPH:quinone reductase-like Zn-dependent oxidoreductase/acyl carrier protein